MFKIIHHPEAEAELINAAIFYNERVPGLGEDFLDEVGKTVAKILQTPTRFRIVESEIRICSVKRFPYSILYRIEKRTVRILAIKHHSRNPDYWKHRKKGGRV